MIKRGIGILGGSFDPVHLGHIQTAQDVQSLFQFKKIIFMPCGQQPLKLKTNASPEHRVQMLKLALRKHLHFELDEREIFRQGPSYTIDTLKEMRLLYPQEPIIWLLGEDAFAHIKQWHRYQELLQWAHLLVLSRPSTSSDWRTELKDFISSAQTYNPKDLTSTLCGNIFIFETLQYPYSSSEIRQALIEGKEPIGLQSAVAQYIQNHQLYA